MITAPRPSALTTAPVTDGVQVVFAPRSRESLWVLVALLLIALGLAIGEGFTPTPAEAPTVAVVSVP